MTKKSQAFLEFMLDYGWAILVVLAAIITLVYFDIGIKEWYGNCIDNNPKEYCDRIATDEDKTKSCSQYRKKTQSELDIDDCNNNPREDEKCKCEEYKDTDKWVRGYPCPNSCKDITIKDCKIRGLYHYNQEIEYEGRIIFGDQCELNLVLLAHKGDMEITDARNVTMQIIERNITNCKQCYEYEKVCSKSRPKTEFELNPKEYQCELWRLNFYTGFEKTNNTYLYTDEALEFQNNTDFLSDIKNKECIKWRNLTDYEKHPEDYVAETKTNCKIEIEREPFTDFNELYNHCVRKLGFKDNSTMIDTIKNDTSNIIQVGFFICLIEDERFYSFQIEHNIKICENKTTYHLKNECEKKHFVEGKIVIIPTEIKPSFLGESYQKICQKGIYEGEDCYEGNPDWVEEKRRYVECDNGFKGFIENNQINVATEQGNPTTCDEYQQTICQEKTK